MAAAESTKGSPNMETDIESNPVSNTLVGKASGEPSAHRRNEADIQRTL
jgi:hypothetical protein